VGLDQKRNLGHVHPENVEEKVGKKQGKRVDDHHVGQSHLHRAALEHGDVETECVVEKDQEERETLGPDEIGAQENGEKQRNHMPQEHEFQLDPEVGGKKRQRCYHEQVQDDQNAKPAFGLFGHGKEDEGCRREIGQGQNSVNDLQGGVAEDKIRQEHGAEPGREHKAVADFPDFLSVFELRFHLFGVDFVHPEDLPKQGFRKFPRLAYYKIFASSKPVLHLLRAFHVLKTIA